MSSKEARHDGKERTSQLGHPKSNDAEQRLIGNNVGATFGVKLASV